MKLELKHLAPYLPYGLKIDGELKECSEYPVDDTKPFIMGGQEIDWLNEFDNFKPILRPLKDVYNLIEINENLFIPHEKYDELFGPNDDCLFEVMNKESGICIEDIPNLPYYVVEWLASLHFDVFGLIEQGLAIDIKNK